MRQSGASLAVVAAVMDLRRGGPLRLAEPYKVKEEAGGEGNLKDCVVAADGKVPARARRP